MAKNLPQGGLQRLIQERRGNRSYESLSRDCGGTPAKPNLVRLATDEYKSFPRPDAMIGLAKGLKVRVQDIVVASAISCGIQLPKGLAGSSDDLVIPGAGKLPDESRSMLEELAGNMLWWQEQVEAERSKAGDSKAAEGDDAVDNVTELRPDWGRMAADTGEPGVDPEQQPED
ncbi:hypothetical protein [Zhihengliuella flava]|uniref:Uncharacterized protein n=1 Tax=Zhihengliuella flava TaxID=1285193 RepID=A0A931DE23_9MICC|nr:hypothetical protein [Zhihengliuella flava]MBG6085861.1 hypothetical protein [Zhihengliuella flava]